MDTLGQLGWALDDGHGDDSSSREDHAEPISLLQLPDPCLLLVLQHCAEDPRSLFSAARTHSRLHQAAVLAASNIRVTLPDHSMEIAQTQLDSILLYLDNYGQKVSSIEFEKTVGLNLRHLPNNKLHRLSSLTISGVHLGLQILYQGASWEPHVGIRYQPLVGVKELGTALAALPGLQHLSIKYFDFPRDRPVRWGEQHPLSGLMSTLANDGCMYHFQSDALQGVQQLTYLELVNFGLQDEDSMQQLQGLTRLQDLRLDCCSRFTISSSMLSGSQQLTRLELCVGLAKEVASVFCKFQPGVLAGRTQLRHLKLMACTMGCGASSEVTELLSHLQQLQQLTFLSLRASLTANGRVPAAAYSALTASSRLQYLDLDTCHLPEEVWQHVFPAGRQLPHLQELHINWLNQPDSWLAESTAAPEGSRLISCCPGLRSLQMLQLQYSAELLAPLTGLSGLRDLSLGCQWTASMGLEVVTQLTGLERLYLRDYGSPEIHGLVLHLTQLQRLTHLYFCAIDLAHPRWEYAQFYCTVQDPSDVPVWRQVLQRNLHSNDPEVAQQAATALEHHMPAHQPHQQQQHRPQPADRQQQQQLSSNNSTPSGSRPPQQAQTAGPAGGSPPCQPQQQPRHSTNPSAAAGRTNGNANIRRTGRGGNNGRQGRPPWR